VNDERHHEADDDGGAPCGFAWFGGGWRPRTCAKSIRVRVRVSGEVRGGSCFKIRDARCS